MEKKKRLTKVFWDANPCGSSQSWDESKRLRYTFTDSYLSEYLREEIFSGQSVLEVGCGQGIDASEISRYCNSYCGIDISENSLRIADNVFLGMESIKASTIFLEQDAENIGFADETFNLVYSIGVLHHTERIESAIDQIYRVLKRRGILIMMLYRRFTPLWLIIRITRGILALPWIGAKFEQRIISSLRARKAKEQDSLSGTALLELIGSPIINTYSNKEVNNLLGSQFLIQDVAFFRTGVDQFIRILPSGLQKRWPQKRISSLDKRLSRWLGFYQVVVAEKL